MTKKKYKKRKRGNRPLPIRLREEMFRLYCAGESLAEIGRTFNVSQPTISKWRFKDNWDRRRETVHAQVRDKTNEATTKEIINGLELVNTTLAKLEKEIRTKGIHSQSRVNDLDRLLRLRRFLLGQPDSIQKNVDGGPDRPDLSKFSIDELEREAKRIDELMENRPNATPHDTTTIPGPAAG